MAQRWANEHLGDTYRVNEIPWEDNMMRLKRKEWPQPTMDEPSLEKLTEWWESGFCLATDGCELRGSREDMEGKCVHEHRSWLKFLDMCDSSRAKRVKEKSCQND